MGATGIVIVGGGLAAVRVCEQLRKSGDDRPITLVAAEDYPPYDRPPLSKEFLVDRAKTLADVALKPAEFYTEHRITVRSGSAARSLDTSAQTLTLEDGSTLGYDELIVATGLTPKRIGSWPDLTGIHVLRSLADATALRDHAATATRAVIVGAGFIGCEVAASLRALGVEVVLVEPQPTPLAGVLGEEVGRLVARLHRDAGVDVRTGTGVSEVRGERAVREVLLSDGEVVVADLVVLGIGSRPATAWLAGSGVDLDPGDGGVLCDAAGRTSAGHVWALGDVAAWTDAHGHRARVEHWSNVADQARVLVAGSVVAGVMRKVGPQRCSASTSAARRTLNGAAVRSSSPSASRSKATNEAGSCAASIRTRESAGWMRCCSAGKSRPASPLMTISPSITQRGGSSATAAATSSGK